MLLTADQIAHFHAHGYLIVENLFTTDEAARIRAITGSDPDIAEEFDLARNQLLLVTQCEEVLDTEPWLQHSIQVRNPYVDPMNFVQIALLRRLRLRWPDCLDSAIIFFCGLSIVFGLAGGLECC